MAAATLAAMVALLVLLARPASQPPDDVWGAVAEGVRWARLETPGGQPLFALRVDPRRARIRVLRAADADGWTAAEAGRQPGTVAAWNGGFFDEQGRPMGLLVSDGVALQELRRVDWGVFFVDAQGPHLLHTRDYRPAAPVQQGLQSGPRLLVDGQLLRLKKQSAARTAMGLTAGGELVAVASADFAAVSFDDLAAVMLDLGCRDALNLDGGPSTQMWVGRAGDAVVDQPGGTPVPVVVTVSADPLEPAGCSGTAR